MLHNLISVYIRTNEDGEIVAVNSGAFLSDKDLTVGGWIKIDEGIGDKYHHAQGHYFDAPIVSPDGTRRYRYAGGNVVENDILS